MSSSDPTINEALDIFESRLRADVASCETPEEVRDLILHLIFKSEQWCGLPRVDRTRWLDRIKAALK